MNKKLLFGFMSLAALAACTNDDFESQNGVAEEKSPIQFEVINNNEVTRASMNGNKIVWSAAEGDLFTLYHGVNVAAGTGYQNATYKAEMGDGGSAVLTTPSMILAGKAIMTWPVDTTFTQDGSKALKVSIPDVQTNIENNIPYVSDVIDIKARTDGKGVYNYAGYDRKYPVYMRPMASQLTIKADYAGTESQIAELYTGANAIDPIKVTDIKLVTGGQFTTGINLSFTAIVADDATDKRWDKAEPNNAWSHIVGFGAVADFKTEMTAKGDCLLDGNQGCKFLILPQSTADANSAVVVNTIYGKVVVAANGKQGSKYAAGTEDADIWYRYISATAPLGAGETKAATAEASGDNAGKYKTTANIQNGMTQTFTAIDGNKAPDTDKYVAGEDMGGAVTRYVKVLLKYLDMSDLHITSDKQLRDAARVWQHIGAGSVTVFLDGDNNKEFKMSQETIKAINEINAAAAKEATVRKFTVKPCTGHNGNTIVITGGGTIAQDLTFIVDNAGTTVPVALNAGEDWKWNSKNVTVAATTTTAPITKTGISSFINRGTLVSDATATIAIYDNAATSALVTTIPFENNGTWNITAGELNVKFDVTNNGTVNISKGAEYRQDASLFENQAETVPERYFMNDPTKTDKDREAFVEKIGVVNNSGVFGTMNSGTINNYGLIEHADVDAKTYITANQSAGATFANAFNDNATMVTTSPDNKLGRINLPYSNRKETQLSISNTTANGLVSVTVSTEAGSAPKEGKLDLTDLGDYVNFCIINSGVTQVTKASDKVEYLEFNAGSTEIEINTDFKVRTVGTTTYNENLTGLIVLSDITIIRNKEVQAGATYLGAKLYKAGAFTCGNFNAYFGKTASNQATKIVTW